MSIDFFRSEQGFRQGDLLSPTLFIIEEEALSKGIHKLMMNGKMKPYYVHINAP